MVKIRELTKKHRLVTDDRLCQCEGEHYYCLDCLVCRADCIEAAEKEAINVDKSSLAGYIDHSNLKQDTGAEEIKMLCQEADEHNFRTVCVNPCFVKQCVELLKNSPVKVCSVVGFPLGANSTDTKYCEAFNCIQDGVSEIDMVINISWLKEENLNALLNEIRSIAAMCIAKRIKLKCIIETCLLSDEEKILAALIVKKGGANYVKTSTGFSTGGATLEDVALLRSVVGSKMGVKASGGIGTSEKAIALILAGADRIGASKSQQIMASL